MISCQLSKSNSLREIEYGMQSTLGDWNHLGIKNIIQVNKPKLELKHCVPRKGLEY